MIVGMAEIGFQHSRTELRIRLDKVFREGLAIAKNRSRKTGKQTALRVCLRTRREASIEGAIDTQRIERGGQRIVGTIGQVGSRGCERTQLQPGGLSNTANIGTTNWTEPSSGN